MLVDLREYGDQLIFKENLVACVMSSNVKQCIVLYTDHNPF